jgi:hypothetical protein
MLKLPRDSLDDAIVSLANLSGQLGAFPENSKDQLRYSGPDAHI